MNYQFFMVQNDICQVQDKPGERELELTNCNSYMVWHIQADRIQSIPITVMQGGSYELSSLYTSLQNRYLFIRLYNIYIYLLVYIYMLLQQLRAAEKQITVAYKEHQTKLLTIYIYTLHFGLIITIPLFMDMIGRRISHLLIN